MQSKWLSGQTPLPYVAGDAAMRQTWQQVVAGGTPTLLLAEFQETYTAGTKTLQADIAHTPHPVLHVDRGGSVTWHGPGQLVVYPIVKLREPLNVVGYVRALEAAVLEFLRTDHGLQAELVPQRTGVWLRNPDRKICAIGVKVAKGTTMHGLALNNNPDFTSAFTGIVPCGLENTGVTSLAAEGVAVDLQRLATGLCVRLEQHLTPLLAPAAEAGAPQ